MRILLAASEMSPFARTGGLADEIRTLAGNMRALGHDVTVVLPYYRCVREEKSLKTKRVKIKFSTTVGAADLPCEVFESVGPDGMKTLFVSREEFFDRTELYGINGRDYQDNAARFIFFTKCVAEIGRRMSPAPDIVHAHGWQTALLPVFVREQRLPWVSVLTPHGLEYQGNFWSCDFALTNLPGEYFSPWGLEYFGSMNCLKAGILFADAVVLPGRRTVAGVQTPEYGCGLENVLREQSHKLEGIPEGLDDAAWPVLPGNPATKAKIRAALLARCGLAPDGRVFLADSSATRGAGMGMLLEVLDRLPSDNIRVLLLGPVAETREMEIALRRHARIFANIAEVDGAILQAVLGGADFLLLPGPVEPGGELLMLALRNGVLPIAAHCGGLRQFVRDYDPVTGDGNGFVFYRQTPGALADAIRRAVTIGHAEREGLVRAARAADFSWPAAAHRHEALFKRLLARAGRPLAA